MSEKGIVRLEDDKFVFGDLGRRLNSSEMRDWRHCVVFAVRIDEARRELESLPYWRFLRRARLKRDINEWGMTLDDIASHAQGEFLDALLELSRDPGILRKAVEDDPWIREYIDVMGKPSTRWDDLACFLWMFFWV